MNQRKTQESIEEDICCSIYWNGACTPKEIFPEKPYMKSIKAIQIHRIDSLQLEKQVIRLFLHRFCAKNN